MNTIAERIYDFLKAFPPFNMLLPESLLSICKSIEVHYVEKDNFIFKTNEPVKDKFYVVKDGDIDPLETNEWLESLLAVIEKDGNQRAHYLIKELKVNISPNKL